MIYRDNEFVCFSDTSNISAVNNFVSINKTFKAYTPKSILCALLEYIDVKIIKTIVKNK